MASAAFSIEEIEYALSTLAYYRGDVPKAARFLHIPARQLEQWVAHPPSEDRSSKIALPGGRPFPPVAFQDKDREEELFAPAPEVSEWMRSVFIQEGSPLFNRDHEHLQEAEIGVLWTNVACSRQGRSVAGTAGFPSSQGDRWAKARNAWLMRQWFGLMPDFLITLDSVYATQAADATWCALLEHELYHCGQARDVYGDLAFNPQTGLPIYTIRGHDCEEFVGVVRRYGAGSAASGTKQLVEAALQTPSIAEMRISAVCGTCLR